MILRPHLLRTTGIAPTREPDRIVDGAAEFDLMTSDPFATLEKIGERMGMRRMSEEQDLRFAEIMAARTPAK